MDFNLTREQQELVSLLEKVGREKLRPGALDRRFKPDETPKQNIKLLADLGIFGLCMPASVGGSEQPYINGILAIEKIAESCPITGQYALMCIGGPAMSVAKWGTEDERQRLLPAVLAGDGYWSISLTEPQAGTDLSALKTSAKIKGSRCFINGHKIFCSHASTNHKFLVFVRFAEGAAGIGAIVISKGVPGFTISAPHRHMSGEPWCELYFDNAEIPVEDILFDGNAFGRLLSTYSLERCAGGVTTLAAARIAMDLAIEHTRERKQFGRPI